MFRLIIGISFALVVGSCGTSLPDDVEQQMTLLPKKIEYNFHVKPILSDRCFACHGPDAQRQEAELRLDISEGAYASLVSGAGKAIVPGSPSRSVLVDRILTDDPEIVMPSIESNLSLTPYEKAILIKWIDQGAKYEDHWAFQKPEEQDIPKAGKGWAHNEIDNFIAAKLDEAQIKPSPEADREQLIRRVYFDLTGLPPQLADLDRWMNDTSPDYYEDMVNSLLASPAYGERMAAHWLDVARFADSEGYLDDFHHTFFPYRDWVIDAFNKNLPYDEFIEWQVGGDQFPEPTTEQLLATTFNRNHKQNSEGGIIPEEFRVEYVADRANTVGTAFMGLTFACARCHDHKYDPISQKNYFELFSFFNSTIERGDGIFAYNAVENGQMVPNILSMNAGPVLALPDSSSSAIREYVLEKIEKKQAELHELAAQNDEEAAERFSNIDASILEKKVNKSTLTHLTFENMKNGKDVDVGPTKVVPWYTDGIECVEGKHGKGLKIAGQSLYVADGEPSRFERYEPFTVSFWVHLEKEYYDSHLLYNGNNRIQGYRGWDVVIDSNHVNVRVNHAHPFQSLDIKTKKKIPLGEWTHITWTYDGSGSAKGMELFWNGEKTKIDIQRDYLYRSTKPYKNKLATVYAHYMGLVIGNRHYDQDCIGAKVDGLRILDRPADAYVARYLYDASEGTEQFKNALSKTPSKLDDFYDRFIDEELENERENLRELQAQEVAAIDSAQEIMIMGDWENERPTYVLERGVYDAHGEQVYRNVPESILHWPEDLPRNRYGLAKWLTNKNHPLTARVTVNQYWYLLFGRGIVETVEDFGNQGALPTHPELLDYLARDFQDNGWDVKRLIKKMVMSATYRQSSKIRKDLEEIDPDNKLLARGPRYRRSAEMVRDNILAAGGLLNERIGGPSTFPYQPEGLWKETTSHPFFHPYEVDYKKGLYRRSIYTFWKRNMPPPSMLIFDAATRGECQVRRQRSNTPLQALVLLNDPQFIEASRAVASRAWELAEGDLGMATEMLFKTLISRSPTSREKELLESQYKEELAYFENDQNAMKDYLSVGVFEPDIDIPDVKVAALSRVANTVLNSTESYYKN